MLEEPFDALPLDAQVWYFWESASAVAYLQGGALHVGVDMPRVDSPSSYVGATSVQNIPSQGQAGGEIVLPPEPMYNAEIYLALHDGAWLLYIDVSQGHVGAYTRDPDNNYSMLTEIEFDPLDHRWTRMAFDAQTGLVEFQTSPSAGSWNTLYSLDAAALGFSFAEARFELGMGSWAGPTIDPDLAAVDNLFVCGS